MLSPSPAAHQTTSDSEVYPSSPAQLPSDLASTATGYHLRAWFAALALIGFVALYFCLIYWAIRLGVECYRLFDRGTQPWALPTGIAATLLAFLLVKGLFARPIAAKGDRGLELTPEAQPTLFAFLCRLADEIGSPRPRRVFLNATVSAAVVSELSLANLLLPAKKDLHLGIGLLNSLNASEFKAVLGHELGHFAQRTTAIGRWVGVAQRVAGAVVVKRDWLDELLAGVSRWDIRIAWLGWLAQAWLWSIRSLLNGAFTAVVLLERSLSREMEFQADLVAVSVAGSDALVNSLFRLEVADVAWDESVEIGAGLHQSGYQMPDLCAAQVVVTRCRAQVLGQPDYGQPPACLDGNPSAHRIFGDALAQAPRMWASHPSNRDRELNAKARYVAAELDQRSAWVLFHDPASLCAELTSRLFEASTQTVAPQGERRMLEPAELNQAVAAHFSHQVFESRFRGVYLGRSPVREFTRDELESCLDVEPADSALFFGLYPSSISELAAEWRSQSRELAMLRAISRGELTAAGGCLQYQGNAVAKRELPKIIRRAEAHCADLAAQLKVHEAHCRRAHQAIALQCGSDWAAYHRELARLAHYATHTCANLTDVAGMFVHTLRVVAVDSFIDAEERIELTRAAEAMHAVIYEIERTAQAVVLTEPVCQSLGISRWHEVLPRTIIATPTLESLPNWVANFDAITEAYRAPLSALAEAATDHLLLAERYLAEQWTAGEDAGAAPAAPRSPEVYAALVPGAERKRIRDITPGEKFIYGASMSAIVGRTILALLAFAPLVVASHAFQGPLLYIYNGLARPVVVTLPDDKGSLTLGAQSHTSVRVDPTPRFYVVARSHDGELIDSTAFDALTGPVVYNVASAALLAEVDMEYGNRSESNITSFGALRFTTTKADYVFEEPSESILTWLLGTKRCRVFQALPNFIQEHSLTKLLAYRSAADLITSHAMWDPAGSASIDAWLAAAQHVGTQALVLRSRLERDPNDGPALRARSLIEQVTEQ